MLDEFHMWLIGGGIALAVGSFSMWLRVSIRADKKLDRLRKENDAAHKDIHYRLDHSINALRDKIEDIWKVRHVDKRRDDR